MISRDSEDRNSKFELFQRASSQIFQTTIEAHGFMESADLCGMNGYISLIRPNGNANPQYHFEDNTKFNFLIIFFIVILRSYLK